MQNSEIFCSNGSSKRQKRATKILKLPVTGMIPKILHNPGKINLPFIQNRLIEITTQNIEQFLSTHNSGNTVKTILLLSTMEMEGKSVVGSNITKKMIEEERNEDLENWYGNSAFSNVYSQSDNLETFVDFSNEKRPDFRLRLGKITASNTN